MIGGENSRKPVFGFRLSGEGLFAKVSGCLFQVGARGEGAVQGNFFIRRACFHIVHTGDDQVAVEFAAAVNKQ